MCGFPRVFRPGPWDPASFLRRDVFLPIFSSPFPQCSYHYCNLEASLTRGCCLQHLRRIRRCAPPPAPARKATGDSTPLVFRAMSRETTTCLLALCSQHALRRRVDRPHRPSPSDLCRRRCNALAVPHPVPAALPAPWSLTTRCLLACSVIPCWSVQ